MQVEGKIDILMISETKIDEIFPKGNFLIEGFSTPLTYDPLKDQYSHIIIR